MKYVIQNAQTGEEKIVDSSEFGNYGIDINKEAKRIEQEQAVAALFGGGNDQSLTGSDAVAKVIASGGQDFIQKAGDKDARIALAEYIQKLGGIDKYRQELPLKDLIPEREQTGYTAKADLSDQLKSLAPLFQGGDRAGGTGPVISKILDNPLIGRVAEGMVSPETREMRRQVENVTATYANMLSGKVISDKEIVRLQKFLPTSSKNETQNAEDIQALQDRIDKNMKVYEYAKRNGLTVNEAYTKLEKELGLDTEYKQKENKKQTITTQDFDQYWK